MAPADDLMEQLSYGQNLLSASPQSDLEVIAALDLSGTFIVDSPSLVTQGAADAALSPVPGFVFVEAYNPNPAYVPRLVAPARARSEDVFGPFDLNAFLIREKNGEFPNGGGDVDSPAADVLTNNNSGATGTSLFTQSENSLVAFGNTVIVGFNDSGSNAGGSNKFTGFSRSTNGGATFTDGGLLPTNANGDAGDPVLARNNTTGRIYFSTLQWSGDGLRVFRSDDNGLTWNAPVQGAPGKTGFQDKQWLAVDNFAGAGNGNVYHIARDFGSGDGIFMFRSTDHGATFGPSGGTLIASGSTNNVQGAFVTVGPDHSVYAFWFDENSVPERIMMRRSTDQGVSFGAPVAVATLSTSAGFNGDLGLVGQNNGESTNRTIRSNAFPHAVVNPNNGHVYVTYADNPVGADKADVFVAMSSNNGASWSAPTRINDDVGTTDQWQPTLAVTPDGSKLGLFYYSRQEDTGTLDGDPANNQFKYYGRIASISGSTLSFQSSFAISDQPSKPEVGRDSLINSVYMGDYDQAVSTPGAFHVVWADNTAALPSGGGRMDPNVFYEKIQLGLSVTTTTPAANSAVNVAPTVFTVNVTDPVNPGTVNASDLLVNGIPANSVAYVAGSTTLNFTYLVSPVTVQGLQTLHLDAAALTRASDNDPLALYDAAFSYDVVTLQVVATTPPFPNGVFTLPGPFTYDVTFNEPIAPGSLQTSDLLLSGLAGAFVSGVTLLPGNTTARFTISGILSEGALVADILAGAVTDVFSNIGLGFNATYQVDYGTFPFPAPVTAQSPLGSLIYQRTFNGLVNLAGDVDSFTLNIDANQRISVLVTPTAPGLQPRIQLFDPTSASLGFASAPVPGQVAGMQTIPASLSGLYTFAVSAVGGTVGDYTLQIILNSAFELEGEVVGAVNNSSATAQDIVSSFVALNTTLAQASRGAIVGQTDPAGGYSVTAQAFSFTDISATGITILQNVDDSSATVTLPFAFNYYGTNYTQLFPSSNGLITFGSSNSSFSNTSLASNPAQAAIAVFWDDLYLFNSTGNATLKSQVIGPVGSRQLILQWDKVNFYSNSGGDTLTFQAILSEGANTIRFNYLDLATVGDVRSEGTSANVGVKRANPTAGSFIDIANPGPNSFVGSGWSTLISPLVAGDDWYRFSAIAGERVSLAIQNQAAGNVDIRLVGTDGVTVLATGATGTTNVHETIQNFPITVSGNYFVRVNGDGNVPYSVVVTRDAVIDGESNDSLATAQDLTGSNSTLGYSATGSDWYQITLAANEGGFDLETRTPADDAGQFVNLLNPKVQVFNASNVDITPTVTILPDGRNELASVSGLTPGATYFVRVTSEAATSGEYFVGLEPYVGTLSATLVSGVLTIQDITALGENNRFTIRVIGGGTQLEISDTVGTFLTAPTGGALSNLNRTLTIPLAGISSVVVNGMGGDDIYLVESTGSLPNLVLDSGTGLDQLGLPTQRIAPSTTTAITIIGGDPAGSLPPTGNTVGDALHLDVSAIPLATTRYLHGLIIGTVPGQVLANGYAPFLFSQIENIGVWDNNEPIHVQMGDLFIRGSSDDDLIQFARAATLTEPLRTRLRYNVLPPLYFTITGKTVVYAGAGRDTVAQVNLGQPAEFYGEFGDDILTGTANNDLLVGGAGNDRINAGGGDNVLWGDDAPTIAVPAPQDLLAGGNDNLSSLTGADVIYGGGGADQVSSGAGNDYVSGGFGDDVLDGNEGDDRLYGGEGNDILNGYAGNDLLSGGNGNDALYGTTGNDVLFGGNGEDRLDGGNGDDLLITGSVANENSSLTALPNTSTFIQTSYSNPADNDAALVTLLAQWGLSNDRSSVAAISHDGVDDDVLGRDGDDDFCWETADILNEPSIVTPFDFLAIGMGTDERFGPL